MMNVVGGRHVTERNRRSVARILQLLREGRNREGPALLARRVVLYYVEKIAPQYHNVEQSFWKRLHQIVLSKIAIAQNFFVQDQTTSNISTLHGRFTPYTIQIHETKSTAYYRLYRFQSSN